MGEVFIGAKHHDASPFAGCMPGLPSCLFPVWPDTPDRVRSLAAYLDRWFADADASVILISARSRIYLVIRAVPQRFARPAHLPGDWRPELGASAHISVYRFDTPVHVPLLDEEVATLSKASLAPVGGLAAFPADELFCRLISALRSIRASVQPLLRQGPPAPRLSARAWPFTTVQAA